MARKDVSKLREEAASAIERGKLGRAIELYGELEAAEPASPTWPKRIGETHRRDGNNAEAIRAFERSAEKYALEGFLVQAIAVCKLILQLDPEHSAAQARLAQLMPAPAPKVETPPAVVKIPPRPTPTPEAAPEPEAAPKPDGAIAIPPRAATSPGATKPAPKPVAKPEPAKPAARPEPAKPVTKPEVVTKPAPAKPVVARPLPAAKPARPDAPIDMPSEQRLPRPIPMRPPANRPPTAEPVRRPSTAEPSGPAIMDDIPKIEIPPGSGLDAIDFSTLIPGAQPLLRDDGTLSGVNVLPLGPSDVDLDLSLDDAEVGTDPATDRVPGPAARRALLTTPLFPHVPPRVLERLIARMSLLELAPDEILFREGETGHELFVISEGEVAVESAAVGELARLGPSAFFGEIALVTDLPRSATIRAITRVELLAMNREVLREAVAEHPDIVTVLLRFVRDRLIDRITRTSELFRPFSADERKDLSARFELVEVVPDALLITQGERADGLYLVVAGKVEVRRDSENTLAILGSGDVFGELSLLAGGGSTANVRSMTRVLALRMPASTFQEVIMTHPQVLAYLGDLAERRTPRAQAEEFVDLHLDMLV